LDPGGRRDVLGVMAATAAIVASRLPTKKHNGVKQINLRDTGEAGSKLPDRATFADLFACRECDVPCRGCRIPEVN
jgi:hypothetical protein